MKVNEGMTKTEDNELHGKTLAGQDALSTPSLVGLGSSIDGPFKLGRGGLGDASEQRLRRLGGNKSGTGDEREAETHRIDDVVPHSRLALDKLTANVVLGVPTGCVCAFPLCRQLLCPRTGCLAQT